MLPVFIHTAATVSVLMATLAIIHIGAGVFHDLRGNRAKRDISAAHASIAMALTIAFTITTVIFTMLEVALGW